MKSTFQKQGHLGTMWSERTNPQKEPTQGQVGEDLKHIADWWKLGKEHFLKPFVPIHFSAITVTSDHGPLVRKRAKKDPWTERDREGSTPSSHLIAPHFKSLSTISLKGIRGKPILMQMAATLDTATSIASYSTSCGHTTTFLTACDSHHRRKWQQY